MESPQHTILLNPTGERTKNTLAQPASRTHRMKEPTAPATRKREENDLASYIVLSQPRNPDWPAGEARTVHRIVSGTTACLLAIGQMWLPMSSRRQIRLTSLCYSRAEI